MTEIDYAKIRFKSGLEIHQQLDAGGKKLFCECPAVLRNDEPDFFVERRLHAVAGESGEVDRAAEYQASLKKTFVNFALPLTQRKNSYSQLSKRKVRFGMLRRK